MRTRGGLPVGVQLIAPPWREDLAFEAARRLEAAQLAVSLPPPFGELDAYAGALR
jgi:amidase/aspartyl-tRNA(Asn)/glutamyl-tRNA(Gln) amidotransferase subunit A